MLFITKRKEWRSTCTVPTTPDIDTQLTCIQTAYRLSSGDIKHIANFVQFGLIEDIATRFNQLKRYQANNKSMQTLHAYIIRFGDVFGPIKYKTHIQSKITTLQNMQQRHGADVGKQKWLEFKQKCSGNMTLDRFIEKYGVVVGTDKFKKLKLKQKTWGTLDHYTKKRGLIEGTEIYNKKLQVLRFGASRLGFIQKYGQQQGIKILKQRKNNTSLESYRERYGEGIGNLKYEHFVARKRHDNSLEGFCSRHGDVIGKQRYEQWITTSAIGASGASKIANQLFSQIISGREVIGVYYSGLNREYHLKCEGVSYLYDFVNTRLGKVIEFNGDIWHANPSIYSPTDTPNPHYPQLTALSIWEKDERKLRLIEEKRGYTTLVVWEKDYRELPEKIIKQCIDFIYG